MAIIGVSKIRSIKVNIKVLVFPLTVTLVTIVLSFFVIREGYSRITKQMSTLDESKTTERILEEKIAVLREIDTSVLERTNSSVIALPKENPGPMIISLIRKFTKDKPFLLEGIKISAGSGSGGDTNKISLSTGTKDVENTSLMFDYIESFLDAIPVSTIDGIEIENLKDGLAFELKTFHYWSSLPTRLPKITEPVKVLFSSEKKLLDRISEFVTPDFSALDPSDPQDRINPFE